MRYREIVAETSSAGGTSAGAVATSIGGLGAGFTDDDSASIYPSNKGKKKKKKTSQPLLRRNIK